MVEPSDRGWTAPVSRRWVLALPLVFGIGSCTQLNSINDQYINAVKKDPMFAWDPFVAVKRTGPVISPRRNIRAYD